MHIILLFILIYINAYTSYSILIYINAYTSYFILIYINAYTSFCILIYINAFTSYIYSSLYVIAIPWVVRLYVEIIHELLRVDYFTYRWTNMV